MGTEKKERLSEEKNIPLEKEEAKVEELSLDDLENVTGGTMRDTVRTRTEDITDSIKDRI